MDSTLKVREEKAVAENRLWLCKSYISGETNRNPISIWLLAAAAQATDSQPISSNPEGWGQTSV